MENIFGLFKCINFSRMRKSGKFEKKKIYFYEVQQFSGNSKSQYLKKYSFLIIQVSYLFNVMAYKV